MEAEVASERRSQCVVGALSVREGPLITKNMSGWPRAVRVIAYVLRWKSYRWDAQQQWSATVMKEEYAAAEMVLLRNIQRQYFAAEIEAGMKELSKRSQIYQYRPFLDEDGLIRCRSRLNNLKSLDFEVRNPIILPGEDHLVDTYVRWVHEALCLHAGSVAGIMQRVRSRFLILRCRRAALKAVRRCKVCAKYYAEKAAEETLDLPVFRMESATARRSGRRE